ncbi:sialate O-acetylesterase [candidate division KSB1 bacterium]|nr:sialate O-acetylesterase [candidate division KSB1 bacterium]
MRLLKIFMLLLSIICLSCSSTIIKPEMKKSKHSTYYYQRKTLFEKLPNSENEIIFLGNSISDGCNWNELFNDNRIKNRGISGDVTDGVLDRLDEVTESKPSAIFIMIGVNDLARGKSVEYIVSNYQKILERIVSDSKETKILVQSVLPVNDEFPKFKNHVNKTKQILAVNKKLTKLSSQYRARYIDLFPLFALKNNMLNPEYSNDGLHLTGDGYLLWKSVVEKYIE